MDMKSLSEADLQAIASGDFSKVSTEGLRVITGENPPRFRHGAVDSALQGATMGFSDEIGAVKDMFLGRGGYSANLRDRALARAAYERENPGRAFAAELGGAAATALVPGIGAARLLSAPAVAARVGPTAARYGGAAVGGGVAGGITGAGTAGEGERLEGAGRGAATGAVLGPVVAGGLQGLGVAGGIVRDATAGIPAVQRVGQAAAGLTGGTIDYAQRGREKFLQALQRDRLDPATMRAARGDKPETLVDLAGPNTLGLADVATKFPGEARRLATDLASERMAGQMERLSGDLGQAFRVIGDPVRLAESFSRQRQRDAAPLYQRAYQEGAQIADSRVTELMALPAFRRAYGVARRLAQYDGVELPADPRKVEVFSLQTLDYVKRGLDDVLYTGRARGSIGNTERNRILEAQQRFLSVLDENVPTYAQARAAWAGPTAMREALEAGGEVTRMSLSQLQQTLHGMSEAQREQFRIGALGAIREKMAQAGDGRDLVRVVYGSPERREILRSLVGSDQFQALEQQFLRERAIRRTDDTIRGNSRTVERQAGMADLEGNTTAVNSILNNGPLRGITQYILRSGSGVGQPTADALGQRLFSTSPESQRQTLQELIDLDRRLRAQAARRGTAAGSAAGTSGGLLSDRNP